MKEGNPHHGQRQHPCPNGHRCRRHQGRLLLRHQHVRRSVHLPGQLRLRNADGDPVKFLDTWTRRAARWFCPKCNRLNPEITSACLTEGCDG
jgi:hypothetical protein